MRKLIYAINLTLDGCCDHTKGTGGGEGVHDYFTALLREVDTLVYGRKTYQLMYPFWSDLAKDRSGPTEALNDFAEAFDAVDRTIVFSRTLEHAEGRTQLVRTDPVAEIQKLKELPGKNILTGGVDIPSQLVEAGIVDEFHFVIQPCVVGEGRRLFDDMSLPEKLELRLVESQILGSGDVALRYVKQ